jgi:ribosomal protein S18 acetylase RimI-like enzyme
MGFFAIRSIFSDEGQVLVSELQGSAVGFAKLIEFQVGGGKFGCILWIGVHPHFRRTGVGSSLTQEGVHRLKQGGSKAVFASAQRRNTRALALLSRNGFRRMGFLELWRFFGWQLFQFYGDIWLAPGEVVLVRD